VAISGTKVAVGAPEESVAALTQAGHAYVFKSTTGARLLSLSSPNAQVQGEFGVSVALGSTKIVVGAVYETVAGQADAGRVYVFKASTGVQTRTLVSPNAQTGGEFGADVALSTGKIAVGAPDEEVGGFDAAGMAYLFQAGTGTLRASFASPAPEAGGSFGWSVGLNGPKLIVGAPYETSSGQVDAGNAYLFKVSSAVPLAAFASTNVQVGGEFGFSVTFQAGKSIVGAPYETAAGLAEGGHAYRFP